MVGKPSLHHIKDDSILYNEQVHGYKYVRKQRMVS